MVRALFALAALENWYLHGVDVKTAFLYGDLEEEIYMEQPEGFKDPRHPNQVWRLKRALYGLKQASRSWWKAMSESMKSLGFTKITADGGVFVKTTNGKTVIAIVYVDDAMFMGPDWNLVLKEKSEFMKKWECHDLGESKEFLRMRINKKGKMIQIDQVPYLQKVLQRYGMINAKCSANTPLPAGWKPMANTESPDPKLRTEYQSIIGSLMYLIIGTRPDIAFAVTRLSQFGVNPSKEHMNGARHVLKYLANTPNYCLVYNGYSNIGLHAYADSDWGTDPNNRKSVTGTLVKMADGAISWKSHQQKTIAGSSTEAEYMALNDASKQLLWLRNLFAEIGYPLAKPVHLAGDNQGSIFMAQNPLVDKRTKHIDIKYHQIQEWVDNKLVELFYIEGEKNPADMLTKLLARQKFHTFRPHLELEFGCQTVKTT